MKRGSQPTLSRTHTHCIFSLPVCLFVGFPHSFLKRKEQPRASVCAHTHMHTQASPFNVFISSGAPDVGRAQLLGMPQHKASATMAGSLAVYVLRYPAVSAEIPILYAHTVHTCCTVRVYDHTMHSERNPLTFAVRLDPKRQTLSVQ